MSPRRGSKTANNDNHDMHQNKNIVDIIRSATPEPSILDSRITDYVVLLARSGELEKHQAPSQIADWGHKLLHDLKGGDRDTAR